MFGKKNKKVESNENKETKEQDIKTGKETVNDNSQNETVNEAEGSEEKEPEISAEEKLKREKDELSDKYLRLYSEFENFRRRTSKERIELMKSAGQDILISLLPILDDFERAIKFSKVETDNDSLNKGVELVYQKFRSTLENKGLKAMESIGKEFDSDFHEAITNIPAPSEDMKGKVVDEVEKGYLLNDKVIRYAKVVVGS